MLTDPYNRSKLFDVLRPPHGMELQMGVGTTYSLDLLALLLAPVAFSALELENLKSVSAVSSLEVLQSLRRYAGRLTVFCQSGQLIPPRKEFAQFVHLERVVAECRANEGSFHPKVWVLRFAQGDDVIYRFACLTRNMTFDHSWDTVLTLEGSLMNRVNGIGRNRPIGDFVAALPGLCVESLDEAARARVAQIADEVRRVEFECPPGVDDLHFWPMGIERARKWPFPPRPRRAAVISPFLTRSALDKVFDGCSRSVLVSTVSALAECAEVPEGVEQLYTLREGVIPEPEEPGDVAPEYDDPAGLHAKCFVFEDSDGAHVFTGSANATHSGLHRNVEFLVQLSGTKSRLGIDALLAPEQGATRLIDILQPFHMKPGPADPHDKDRREAEECVDKAQRVIAATELCLACAPSQDHPGTFDLRVACGGELRLQEVSACCWPVTLPPERALAVGAGTLPTFTGVTVLGVSRFLAFEVSATVGTETCTRRFARKVTLEGAPEDREQLALQAALGDMGQFLRYLHLLLTLGPSGTGIEPGDQSWGLGVGAATVALPPLLEQLLKALARDPARLDEVERTVRDLRKAPAASSVIPPHFDLVWEPVREAREALRS
ncbi:hypothetical protein TBR22_A05970 [Luteitalea sp. TBR-22]|uniref:phospholipase D family protein n=1 Tax=Luteitalea sp. TBR-22 TaxID=2802971 RepID=UPI001AFCBE7A|nr:phospholipase D family protein [Luteitalea sp. TBR-22]BCS31396.1 hypothetical protein TBR22_A05970 [Luteitalea sp. TBR-22]